MAEAFDLARTFVHLAKGGAAETVEVTPSFWRESSASARYDRLVGVFEFASAEDLHASMEEVHPEADELLCVLDGAVDVVLREGDGDRTVALAAGQATIVPRGVWHRLEMRAPGKLLFVNSRTRMDSRPA